MQPKSRMLKLHLIYVGRYIFAMRARQGRAHSIIAGGAVSVVSYFAGLLLALCSRCVLAIRFSKSLAGVINNTATFFILFVAEY